MSQKKEVVLNDQDRGFIEALGYLGSNNLGQGWQGKLASKAGCSSVHVSMILTGKRRGSEQIRRKIAHLFGLELDDFIELGLQRLESRGVNVSRGTVMHLGTLSNLRPAIIGGSKVELQSVIETPYYIDTSKIPRFMYALQVQDNSFGPFMPEGSVLVVCPDIEVEPGEACIYRDGDKAWLRIYEKEGDIHYISSPTAAYGVLQFDERPRTDKIVSVLHPVKK